MAKKKSILDIYKMKQNGEKISWITSYDAPIASFAEQAGMDMILVGDSMGMVVFGFEGTNPVTTVSYTHLSGTNARLSPTTWDKSKCLCGATHFRRKTGALLPHTSICVPL